MKEKILIMTDAPCDIPYEFEEKNPLKVLYIPMVIDGESYYERRDFTPRQYYEILKNAKNIPTTSQINPITFCEEFLAASEKGYNTVIYVSMNKHGSATFSSSEAGRELFYENYPEQKEKLKIHCIPSYTFSLGYGYPIMKACEKVRGGSSAEEIIKFINEELVAMDIRFAIFTFEYAKKSGRLSPFASIVGEALGIRPIATFRQGKNIILKKARGDKSVVPALAEEFFKYSNSDFYGILYGEDKKYGDELEELIYKKTGKKAAYKCDAGASIVTNAGPKIVGIGFYNKEKTAQ